MKPGGSVPSRDSKKAAFCKILQRVNEVLVFSFSPAGRENPSGGAPPLAREECSLRSGVTVASTQPFGQGLRRVQVCHYHVNVMTFSPPLPALAGAGRVSLGLEGLPLAHLLLTAAQRR